MDKLDVNAEINSKIEGSVNLKDMLRKMLETDPLKRISVESAMKHSFFDSLMFSQ